MAYQDSAQSFVRALRAPSDPPRQGDPSKIDIASAAWREASFHVPRKSEVILEWCLTRLLKDGTRHSESTVLDLRYWTLLQDILLFLSTEHSKPRSVHNTWLIPLLNRVPLLPILLLLLSSSLDLSTQKRGELYLYSSKCLALVWTLAAPKFSPDNLLECFGAVLRVLVREAVGSGENSGITTVCTLVTSSLHSVLSHSSNKKKFSQAFITKHIDAWLNFVSNENVGCSRTYTDICDMGIELLFNVDNLKLIADAPRTNPLFDALRTHISSSQPQLLSTLPFLMAGFTDAIKKRRSLLPSGSASTSDTHSFVTWFFSSCEEILHSVGDLQGNQVWRSRLDLLKVIEDESLFSLRNENMAALLQEEVDACVGCMDAVDGGTVQIAIQCLCVLSRIDYDLVEASTSRILPKFLTLHQSSRGDLTANYAHEFLSLSLSFHTKTRTLPVHISHLIDSCTQLLHLSSLSIRASYDGLVASPALTMSHLNKLSRAVRTFITPGQTLDTARQVLAALREIWEHFRDMEKVAAADRGRGARKKRRIPETSNAGKADPDVGAVTFTLAARIAMTVLTSLPLHTITEAEQAQLKTTVTESLAGFVREAILTGTGAIISGSSERERDAWAIQVVAAAALRLSYMLQLSGRVRYGHNDQNDLGELAAAGLKVDDCLPEFYVEILRYLLQHKSHRDFQQREILLDVVLNFLEVHLPTDSPAPSVWSGRSSQLSFDEEGRALSAIVLLRLLLDRNLEVINAYGSPKQLERLVNLLHLPCVELEHEYGERGLSFVTTVHECLHSATFWEQGNIRSSFFAVQHARSAFLDGVDVAKLQKTKKHASGHPSENQLREAVKACTLLLYPSSECIPKSSRNDLLRRAVILDILLGPVAETSIPALQVVRTFLARTLSLLWSWEHEEGVQYLHFLMTSPVPASSQQVTIDLVQGHLRAAYRAAIKGSADAAIDAIQICRTQPLGDWLLSKDSGIPLRGSAQLLMDVAMDGFSLSSFPPDLVEHMLSLFEHVFDQLHPIICRLASHHVTERDEILRHSDILLLWGRVITFGRHLKHPKSPSPGLGAQILEAVGPLLLPWDSKDSNMFTFCDAMHAILVAELQLFPKEQGREVRESHLQRIVTTYMVFAPLSMSEQCNLDENMAKLFRTLSPSEFSSCLQFVIEALSPNGIASDYFACLVRLVSLALLNAPENTLKIVQAYVKECLDVFVNEKKLSSDHVLRLPVLTFISDLCSKRPASIRPQNVVSIWVLLSRLLAGSNAHDPKTNNVVFHEVVAIVGSLVRLRRDLVVTTLPHLTSIIRRLLFALRSPRPLLGGKQYTIVADSFPAWVNPSQPLGAEESKALSRLLTSLSAKTSIRVHGPSADPHKQESLARPLSKHVTCVLQAYLEVLNDPLCILPADIRRELQPGLFVLCDMLNEHTRDAVMVSALDASGKAAMKSLWREYEKQRYTGKG